MLFEVSRFAIGQTVRMGDRPLTVTGDILDEDLHRLLCV